MSGHFEGGRWLADPPAPAEPMSIAITLDTARLQKKLAALAGGLREVAYAFDRTADELAYIDAGGEDA